MNLITISPLFVATLLLTNTVLANELVFPTTEAEIVQALSSSPFQRKSMGPDKGLADIIDDNPKVGALIHFDFDSATIKEESYPLLREYAKALKGGLAETVLEIAGHTDNEG